MEQSARELLNKKLKELYSQIETDIDKIESCTSMLDAVLLLRNCQEDMIAANTMIKELVHAYNNLLDYVERGNY